MIQQARISLHSLAAAMLLVLYIGMAVGQPVGPPILDPQVQADLLNRQIIEAYTAGRMREVLSLIDQYKGLQTKGVKLPTPILMVEAKSAAAVNDSERALQALAAYMNSAQKTEASYNEALTLYPRYQQAVVQRVTAASEEKKRKEEEDAAKRKPVALAAIPSLLESISAGMVTIPGGQFRMGSAGEECDVREERPQHAVHVKGFRLSKHELSFDQYSIYAGATGRPLSSSALNSLGTAPAILISWEDANRFVIWLNELGGKSYRLPSEAEWEYAARAGTTTKYPWGNKFDASRANRPLRSLDMRLKPRGSYPPNAFGLYDVVGNAMEWTQDCWHDSYVGAPKDGSAWTESACMDRVVRDFAITIDASHECSSIAGRGGWNATGNTGRPIGIRLAQDM